MNTEAALLKKFEQLSVRFVALEAEQTRLREDNARLSQENSRLQTENRLLRRKLDHYIGHYFGGKRNEALDKHQLELLLAGLPNVIELPAAWHQPI